MEIRAHAPELASVARGLLPDVEMRAAVVQKPESTETSSEGGKYRLLADEPNSQKSMSR